MKMFEIPEDKLKNDLTEEQLKILLVDIGVTLARMGATEAKATSPDKKAQIIVKLKSKQTERKCYKK